MDVWQLIAHDHAYLAHLITEIRHAFGATPTRDREEILLGLIDELAAHAEGLEASLYAPLRERGRTRRLAEELHHEHARFIGQLDALARSRARGATRPRRGTALDIALIGQHLGRYTRELIPAARELLSPEQVDAAAHAFVRAKMRTLRSRQGRRLGPPGVTALARIGALCALAAGIGYLAGRSTASGAGGRSEASARSIEPRGRDRL